MDNILYISDEITGLSAMLAAVVLIMPLLSFMIMNLSGWKNGINPGWIASGLVGCASLAAWLLFFITWNSTANHPFSEWIRLEAAGNAIVFNVGFLIDNVSTLMAGIVLTVSFLIHIFSIDYMRGEANYNRYFSFLGFFTFSMLGIVLADNLLMVFIFWELVGFSSYLLIGFWFHKPTAAYAARKAFMVNRIGDLGFLVALMTLWSLFGTLDIQELKEGFTVMAASGEGNYRNHEIWLFIAGAGIFSGAVGKSAQFPLLVWLPDAMEGPTPVSALIHAATMVAAGVYLLARTFALLTMPVLDIILITGSLTAFMGAVAALTQNDIKKVLAYSTISQLGFMVMGIGAGARDAALFHLFTHAFFKAGLFLSAG
ncbi:MAG TPA: proton-conducting transporter membrane subunit, partial [Cyclobacteriaceae bacterium]|nr:proton-conducting transporter membrane subunit [Cyclobacteriaceae bacterium]